MKEKEQKIKVEVQLDVKSAELQVEEIQKRLQNLLNNPEAIDNALTKMREHQMEGWEIWLKAIPGLVKNVASKSLAGAAESFISLGLDLDEHTKKFVPYFARIKDEIYFLVEAESKLYDARKQQNDRIIADMERNNLWYDDNRKKEGLLYGNLVRRRDAYLEFNELYKEENENLENNIRAYDQLDMAVKSIQNGLYKKSGNITYSLFGETKELKNNFSLAEKEMKNLMLIRDLYMKKATIGRQARDMELKAKATDIEAQEELKRIKQINAEKRAEQETQVIPEQKVQRKSSKEEISRLQEHNKRIAEISEESPIIGTDMRKKEFINAPEPIEIDGTQIPSKHKEVNEGVEQVEADSFNKRLEQQKEFNEEADTLQLQNSSDQQETVQQTNDEVADVEKESHKTRLDQWKDYAQKAAEISQKISEATSMVTNSLGGMFGQLGSYYADQVQAFSDKIAVLDEEKEAALERVALSEEERQEKENIPFFIFLFIYLSVET